MNVKPTSPTKAKTQEKKCQFCIMTQKKDKNGQLVWVHDYDKTHPQYADVNNKIAGIKSYLQDDDRYANPEIKT